MPRVIALVNGSLGATALKLLADQLVGVVLHPESRRRAAGELNAAIPQGLPCFSAGDDDALEGWMRSLSPSHGVSVMYGRILKAQHLACCPYGIANLHPSLLPWGRGAHPNAWAIAEGHPMGVTLHLIDEGIDTGPILAQCEIPSDPLETAKQLYERLLATAAQRLEEWLPRLLRGELRAQPQASAIHPTRKSAELYQRLQIDPEGTYQGRELIDLLRATTFPPYPGAVYEIDGRRCRLSLHIEEEET